MKATVSMCPSSTRVLAGTRGRYGVAWRLLGGPSPPGIARLVYMVYSGGPASAGVNVALLVAGV